MSMSIQSRTCNLIDEFVTCRAISYSGYASAIYDGYRVFILLLDSLLILLICHDQQIVS